MKVEDVQLVNICWLKREEEANHEYAFLISGRPHNKAAVLSNRADATRAEIEGWRQHLRSIRTHATWVKGKGKCRNVVKNPRG